MALHIVVHDVLIVVGAAEDAVIPAHEVVAAPALDAHGDAAATAGNGALLGHDDALAALGELGGAHEAGAGGAHQGGVGLVVPSGGGAPRRGWG